MDFKIIARFDAHVGFLILKFFYSLKNQPLHTGKMPMLNFDCSFEAFPLKLASFQQRFLFQ
jgi:hypothetical protein